MDSFGFSTLFGDYEEHCYEHSCVRFLCGHTFISLGNRPAGLYGASTFSLLRYCQSVLHNGWAILHFHNYI